MDLNSQREYVVRNLLHLGYIKSPKVKKAMLKVDRELFVPKRYILQSYTDEPLPIPGGATISAPHIHAITLSELDLKEGENVLEIGAGSGVLLAYMKELVGKKGNVVGIEISKETYNFAKNNIKKSGYKVTLIHGDGSLGYPKYAPYDKIVVSAASPDIPKTVIDQLKINGTMLAVVGSPSGNQYLMKLTKTKSGKLIEHQLLPVIFVPLKGKYGWK